MTAAAARGTCRAGFYCVSGVTKSTPNNPLTASNGFIVSAIALIPSVNPGLVIENIDSTLSGNICPTGYYCGAGVSVKSSCNPGTFLPY